MIQAKNLSLHRGAQVLFSNASFQIHPGQKVAIAGSNGAGKSSLMALILHEISASSGDLDMPPNWVVAHVAQESEASDRTALQVAMDGHPLWKQIAPQLAKAEAEGDGETLAELHHQMETAKIYGLESQAAQLLAGLGFSEEAQQKAVREFSGGWRMRIHLAQALMSPSDCLLLDEPTNHLDLDAVIWLEGWLKTYPGTLIFISHDRDFLDALADGVLLLDKANRQLTFYRGGYSDYERQKAEQEAQQAAMLVKQQTQVAHLQSYIDRFRAKATKAKQAQSRIKALERMTLITPAMASSPFHFAFFPPKTLPNPLLQMRQANLGYGDKIQLHQVGLSLDASSRIGLLGRNGAGKSTLIKTLAGTLPLVSGEMEGAKSLAIGYFAQHQLETLRPEWSPLDHLRKLDPQAREQNLRDYIGGFGFTGDSALAPTEPFSGGEKARLALALVVYQKPNLLLLDEPTNHLDLDMREALAMALQNFEGAMILISHDRHLLAAVCDEFLLVDNHQVQPFDGDLDDYAKWLKTAAKNSQKSTRPGETKGEKIALQAPVKSNRSQADIRRLTKPLRDEVTKVEKALDCLHQKQQAIDTLLADSSVYDKQHANKLKQHLDEKRRLAEEETRLEEAYLHALEALSFKEQTLQS